MPFPVRNTAEVRDALIARREIALLDVREEDEHAKAHPLFAANFPLAHIEMAAGVRLPRRDACIVLLDDGAGEAVMAAGHLAALGYTDVAVLADGLAGWRAAGGEIFCDVNVPSKAFGELVESVRHTPSLSAQEVQALIDAKADIVIVDARRFDEYQTMCIPTATSVPGAELALRVPLLAPQPQTLVIVNCAGRTRSIIGTQSLINAGLPNPVAALRNGTIGWTLAGQKLDRGQQRCFVAAPEAAGVEIAAKARAVANKAGVRRATRADLLAWQVQQGRSTYFFDVRTPQEYTHSHLPGFLCAPGGQLVQETEMLVPVRGARIVLADDDGVRANMTASWLSQMAWETYVVDGLDASDFSEQGNRLLSLPSVKRYRRPYEGTDNPRAAMQAYLEWEYGLVAQLQRDGTHHFTVI
jgi:rhodanese-related sulfurtransferase